MEDKEETSEFPSSYYLEDFGIDKDRFISDLYSTYPSEDHVRALSRLDLEINKIVRDGYKPQICAGYVLTHTKLDMPSSKCIPISVLVVTTLSTLRDLLFDEIDSEDTSLDIKKKDLIDAILKNEQLSDEEKGIGLALVRYIYHQFVF
jgi:hypothetical protein